MAVLESKDEWCFDNDEFLLKPLFQVDIVDLYYFSNFKKILIVSWQLDKLQNKPLMSYEIIQVLEQFW